MPALSPETIDFPKFSWKLRILERTFSEKGFAPIRIGMGFLRKWVRRLRPFVTASAWRHSRNANGLRSLPRAQRGGASLKQPDFAKATSGRRRASASQRHRLHQLHPFTSQGDGITQHMLTLQRVLNSAGIGGKVFAFENRGAPGIESFPGAATLGPQDLLLVHHSQGHPRISELLHLPQTLYLMYHNITPAELLPHDAELQQLSKLGRRQLLPLAQKAERIFAASPFTASELRSLGFASEILPQIDLEECLFGPPGSPRDLSCFRLLFTGRKVPHKNQAFLVKTAYALQQQVSQPVELYLVGGEDRLYGMYLRRLAQELGMQQQVFFYDKVSQERLQSLYQHCNLFVCASRHEGFCVPLVEAMQAELPVFYLPFAAVPETMGGAGVRGESASPSQFAKVLLPGLNSHFREQTLRFQAMRLEELKRQQNGRSMMAILLSAVLKQELQQFQSENPQLLDTVHRFQTLLQSDAPFDRASLPGHFTASAFVFSPNRDRIALLFHRKLQRWLQPGGHADGESDLFRVATKEVEEEMGLRGLIPLRRSSQYGFVDLDIHAIPENAKDPLHYHFDVRFAFQAPDTKLVQNSESLEVRWFSLEEAKTQVGEPAFERILNLLPELQSECSS